MSLSFPRIKSIFNHFNTSKNKNVFKLAFGTLVSQGLIVVSTPLLSRFYGPAGFGLFAFFISLTSAFAVLSSLRYENTIVLPKYESESKSLLHLSIFISSIFSIILFTIWKIFEDLLLLSDKSQTDIVLNLLQIAPYLPFSVFLYGVFQSFKIFLTRKKYFSLINRCKIEDSIFATLFSFSFLFIGPPGLILGHLLGKFFAITVLLRKKIVFFRFLFDFSYIKKLYILFMRYKKYSLLSCIAAIINVFGREIPLIVLISAYGLSDAGEFLLCNRLILIPTTLISTSIANELLSRSSSLYNKNQLKEEVTRSFKKLFSVSILLCLVILAVSPLTPFILGSDWNNVPLFMLIILPRFIGIFTVSSLSTAMAVPKKRLYDVSAHISQAFITIVFTLLPIYMNLNSVIGYSLYSLGSFCGYMSFYVFMRHTVVNYEYTKGSV